MVRWKFKSCPRCTGDTFIDTDRDGRYEQCPQCSYRRELKSLAKFREQKLSQLEEHALRGDSHLKTQLFTLQIAERALNA